MDEITHIRHSLTPPPPPAWLRWICKRAAYILGTVMLCEASFIFGLLLGLAR